MPVTVIENTNDLMKALRTLTQTRVLVGVPSDSEQPHLGISVGTDKRQDSGDKQITNAVLAYIHTNGEPALNIPARPFLVPGIERIRDKIVGRLRNAATAALSGNYDAVDRYFDAIGLEAQAAARLVITEGIPPPLAESTVQNRRRRSKGSSYRRKATTASQTTPLLDTGQLLNSISYVKRKGA